MAAAAEYTFSAFAGRSRPAPNAAFLASLIGHASFKVAAAHWLAVVLPGEDTGSATNPGFCGAPVRLTSYVFTPSIIFDDAVDSGGAVLFPLPLPLSAYLQALLAAGMPSSPVSTVEEAHDRVSEYSLLVPAPVRTFGTGMVHVVAAVGTSLEGVSPLMFRGASPSNVLLAWLNSCLPGACINLTTGLVPSALALLKPANVDATDPPELVSVKVVTAYTEGQPEPPFDRFVKFEAILAELMRRRHVTEVARFAPLFETHWKDVYPTFTSAFPSVGSAWLMKRTVQTLAQSADISLSFTPSGLAGVVILLKGLLRQLEADAPALTSDTDARITTLVRLLRRSASSVSAPQDTAEARDGTDERMDKLLSNPRFEKLLTLVTTLNTTTFVAADASRLVLCDKHPAGHIIMATTRSLPQAVWSSILGMRQRSAWQTMFDRELAVDRHGVKHSDWGCMLPMKGDDFFHARLLVLGQLDKVPDWWLMLQSWVKHYHGSHVLDLPMYTATSDPLDFWLSPDRLRLAEPVLNLIFSLLSYDESRTIPSSFRHWLSTQLERSTQLIHIPASSLAQQALIADTKVAVKLLLSDFSAATTTMFGRPFHEAVRHEFNPPGNAASAFAVIDKTIRETQAQVVLARKGQAAHQLPQLQGGLTAGLLPTPSAVGIPGPKSITLSSLSGSPSSAGPSVSQAGSQLGSPRPLIVRTYFSKVVRKLTM